MPSNLEAIFSQQIRALKIPGPKTEYRFHAKRRFLFDFAWPEFKVAVEIEGGTWNRKKPGRHTRG